MHYYGMSGYITLTSDKMSNCIRRELDLPATCDTICLSTCEAIFPTRPGGPTTARKISPFELIPVLAATAARRRRYGVTYSD